MHFGTTVCFSVSRATFKPTWTRNMPTATELPCQRVHLQGDTVGRSGRIFWWMLGWLFRRSKINFYVKILHIKPNNLLWRPAGPVGPVWSSLVLLGAVFPVSLGLSPHFKPYSMQQFSFQALALCKPCMSTLAPCDPV